MTSTGLKGQQPVRGRRQNEWDCRRAKASRVLANVAIQKPKSGLHDHFSPLETPLKGEFWSIFGLILELMCLFGVHIWAVYGPKMGPFLGQSILLNSHPAARIYDWGKFASELAFRMNGGATEDALNTTPAVGRSGAGE